MNVKRLIAGGVGGAALCVAVAPMAFAAPIGAGDEIQTRPSEGMTSTCSVAATGTVDGQNALLTAGHCGKEGDVVYDSEGNRIGEFAYSKETVSGAPLDFGKHDYAVIVLDEGVEVTNTTSGRGAEPRTINGVDTTTGFESFGKPVYKDGSATGRTGGFIIYDTGNETIATPLILWGDSGSPLVDAEGSSHGIASRALIYPFVPISAWQNTDAAISDYEAETGKEFVMTPGDAPAEPKPEAPAQPALPGLSAIPEVPVNVNVSMPEFTHAPSDAVWGSIEQFPDAPSHNINTIVDKAKDRVERERAAQSQTVPQPAQVVQQAEVQYQGAMNMAREAVSQAGSAGVDTSIANEALDTVDEHVGAVFGALK